MIWSTCEYIELSRHHRCAWDVVMHVRNSLRAEENHLHIPHCFRNCLSAACSCSYWSVSQSVILNFLLLTPYNKNRIDIWFYFPLNLGFAIILFRNVSWGLATCAPVSDFTLRNEPDLPNPLCFFWGNLSYRGPKRRSRFVIHVQSFRICARSIRQVSGK